MTPPIDPPTHDRTYYVPLIPPVFTEEASNFDRILKVDAIRRKARIFKGAPHGYYVVQDGGEELLLSFFEGDDIYATLNKLRRPTDNPPGPTKPPSIERTLGSHIHGGAPSALGESGNRQATSRAPCAPYNTHMTFSAANPPTWNLVGPARTRTGDRSRTSRLQESIITADYNSLIPLHTVDGTPRGIFHCIKLVHNRIAQMMNSEPGRLGARL